VKDALGIGAYIIAGFRCLRSYSFRRFQVGIDDRTFNATSCIVANGRRYGGGLVFCPQADMQDGLLDICVIDQKNSLELMRFFFLAWLRRPQKYPWLHFEKARKLSILGSEDILIQTDGEAAGTLPVEISIEPSTFPLVVP
jgi:diacylglycerol kinase family enzyme